MRNIVLITLESTRADHCSFMGYERKTTPNLDKMTQKGLYFENAIAPSLPTGPSLVGMLTGEHSLNDSSWGGVEKADKWRKELSSRKTMAQVLSEKGYETGAFHGNPWLSKLFGFDKGFNTFQTFLSNRRDNSRPTRFAPSLSRIYQNIQSVVKKRAALLEWPTMYPLIVHWLESCRRPYFLWIHTMDAHLPYMAPPKYRIFGNKSTLYLLYLNWNLRRKWQLGKDTLDLLKQVQENHLKVNPKQRNQIVNAYDEAIYFSDELIGKLWDEVRNDDPVFIVCGDHGQGFGEHGFYYHQPMLYEEFIHVPFVIYNAGIEGKIEAPFSLCKMFDVIVELAEKEQLSNSFQYEGQWPISKIFEYGRRKVAVRMEDWKFITGQKANDELYNLRRDPYEQVNLTNENRELADEMREIAKSHVRNETERKAIRGKKLKVKGKI